MSDARSLLRQQRAARRITHPHAAYSDTGKLLCTLCREPVKTESLWDAHINSDGHRRRQTALASRPKEDGRDDTAGPTTLSKRKHGGEEMDEDGAPDVEDEARRKRARADASAFGGDEDGASSGPSKDQETRTPPRSLNRRSSQTPSQGVEVQIPSRPATPRDSSNVSSSSSTTTTLPSRQAGAHAKKEGDSQQQQQQQKQQQAPSTQVGGSASQPRVDEDEWAAFEAEIAATADDTTAAATAYDGATISAPAMTAEESARQRAAGEDEDGDPRRRTSKPEADLEDEREDAARALEDEFDEMRDLEAKVLRLKERRDALRARAASHGQGSFEGNVAAGTKDAVAAAAVASGKENASASAVAVEEDDEDESDGDEDDWDGFRFRTGLAR